MSIIKRLGLVIAVLSAAVIAIGGVSFMELRSAQAAAIQTKDSRVLQLRAAAAVELYVTQVSLQLRHSILVWTPAEADECYKDIAARREAITQTLQDYERRITSDKGREIYSRIPPLVEAFWVKGDKNLAYVQAGQKDAALAYLVREMTPARNALVKALEDIIAYETQALDGDIQNVVDSVDLTLMLQLGAFLGIVASLLVFAWWLRRVLEGRIRQSGRIAQSVADGDLTVPVSDTASDEFTPLLAALQKMQTSLTLVVGNVRTAAESVSTASAEIAAGNHDLSARTEQQAASVQQTVATMEELNATASQNATNTEQAKSLAVQASRTALDGGQAVRKVIETMGDIARSSQKISEIIQVIDGISFQTNILALNAAVEAARAGEQGRGFAVVASEVRTLAQRSAQAAKEISTLIQSSADHVELGSELVNRAGETMTQVVDAIQRVDQIMTDIRDAGTSQARGFHGINGAIESIDHSTQQNAALVEESSASAQSLRQQAKELVDVVAVFRLPHQHQHQAAGQHGGVARIAPMRLADAQPMSHA